MTVNHNDDRDTMLDKVAREYLRGEKEYSTPQSAYRRERRIVDRINGTLEDFRLVQQQINGRTWERLLDLESEEARQARDGMAAVMGLFYEIHEMNDWNFEDTLRRGIEEAYLYGPKRRNMPKGEVRGITLDLNIQPPAEPGEVLQRLRGKLERGERITDREFRLGILFGGMQMRAILLENTRERHLEERIEETKEEIEQEAKWIDNKDVDAIVYDFKGGPDDHDAEE